MAFLKNSFKWGCIFLLLALQGLILLSLINKESTVPTQIGLDLRSEVKIQSKCSVLPTTAQVLPTTAQVLPSTDQVLPSMAKVLSSTAQVLPTTAQVLPTTVQVPNKPLLTILLWTWPGNHTFPLNQCPSSFDVSGCFFTVNRSLYLEANAVVIHHRDIATKEQLPPMPRPLNQYWIWFNLEPLEHVQNLNIMDNVINMTMTYRADSDIFMPYGWLERKDEKEKSTIPTKSKLAAWIVSNWKPNQKRVEYYNELKKHLQVDIYGKYNLPLIRKDQYLTVSSYKFYLAFENYLHEDYITEKLWNNAFLAGTVPVVLGPSRKNYERFIPPDSFIHVDDFSSPRELAAYLLELDKDDQKYRKYFNWRSHYSLFKSRGVWITAYCKVCKALKEAPVYRTIPSIEKWFT